MFRRRLRAPLTRAALALAALATAGPIAACGSAVQVTPMCTKPGSASVPDAFTATASMITLPYGLRYSDLSLGCGPEIKVGQAVAVQYTAWLADGTEFDSSRSPGRQPLVFSLGEEQVTPRGLDIGVLHMRIGGKRRVEIPPALGFGAAGVRPVIPPNATLIIDVEVVAASNASG